jgi:hypothetical protein
MSKPTTLNAVTVSVSSTPFVDKKIGMIWFLVSFWPQHQMDNLSLCGCTSNIDITNWVLFKLKLLLSLLNSHHRNWRTTLKSITLHINYSPHMIVMAIPPSSRPRGNIRKGRDDFRLVLMSLVFYLRLIITLSEKHVTMMEPPQPKQYHPISR